MAARGNACAAAELAESPGKKHFYGYGYAKGFDGYARTDPDLVAAVEELGSKAASGELAQLRVVEIPDDVAYEISDYDGIETVHESHATWS